MDNEKVKRNRNAYKAFVQKTIEGATRISSSKNWITTQEQNNGQRKSKCPQSFCAENSPNKDSKRKQPNPYFRSSLNWSIMSTDVDMLLNEMKRI